MVIDKSEWYNIHDMMLRRISIGVRPHLTVNFNRGFDDVYLVVKDVELADLKLQKEEVQDARWATEEEVLQMIAEGTFIPYHPSLIQTYFAMRDGYGTHK